MDERQRTVLLLYPVGNNDVKFDRACWQRAVVEEGQEQPRAIPFREVTSLIVAALEGASADLLTTDHHAGETRCAIEGDGERTGLPGGLAGARQDEAGARWRVELPIFRNVIRHVRAREPEGEIVVRCIVTDQRSVPDAWTDQDTHCVPALFVRFVVEAAGCAPDLYGRVTIGEPHTLRQNPASFDQMSKAYTNEVMPAFADAIAGADACYYSAGTGTPAMTFSGATTFGSDARVSFIYKMNGAARVEDIGEFRKLPQQRTLDLLDRSLARFDLALAADLLDRDDTGFNRHDPTVERAIAILKLYRDWEGEHYGKAVDHGPVSVTLFQVARIVSGKAQGESTTTWSDYWSMVMFSTAARLRIDLARGETPEFIDRFMHFIDVCQIFLRSWYGYLKSPTDPGRTMYDVPAHQRAGLPAVEKDKSHTWNGYFSGYQGNYALKWRKNHPPTPDPVRDERLPHFWNLYLLLIYVGKQIKSIRNQRTHQIGIYDGNELSAKVRELLSSTEEPDPAFESDEAGRYLLRLAEVCVYAAPRRGDALPRLDDVFTDLLNVIQTLGDLVQPPTPEAWQSAQHVLAGLTMARNAGRYAAYTAKILKLHKNEIAQGLG